MNLETPVKWIQPDSTKQIPHEPMAMWNLQVSDSQKQWMVGGWGWCQEIWGDVSVREENCGKNRSKTFTVHKIENGASSLRLLSIGLQCALHKNQSMLWEELGHPTCISVSKYHVYNFCQLKNSTRVRVCLPSPSAAPETSLRTYTQKICAERRATVMS